MSNGICGQAHLSPEKQINLGSFYTPQFLVQKVYELLIPHIKPEQYVLLDTSCGYGNFFLDLKDFKRAIGVDIDGKAIEKAREFYKAFEGSFQPLLLHQNALCNVMRRNFKISETDKLLIVGNPPYNDRTSMVKSVFKDVQDKNEIDSNLRARDLGISFLRSYAQLGADFVCVLHPLSYLIKWSNFKALKNFSASYRLIDSIIISSSIFCPKSIGHFPIIIALYQRLDLCSNNKEMDFEFIQNYKFRTLEGKNFRLSEFDFIAQYINKYPNKKRIRDSQKVAIFYTLRDINALRRSKTFLSNDSASAVYVTKEKYSLYCYVDVFKRYIEHIPYYFGNCDIFIDYARFKALESDFVRASEEYRSQGGMVADTYPQIAQYFKQLLGEHYED